MFDLPLISLISTTPSLSPRVFNPSSVPSFISVTRIQFQPVFGAPWHLSCPVELVLEHHLGLVTLVARGEGGEVMFLLRKEYTFVYSFYFPASRRCTHLHCSNPAWNPESRTHWKYFTC